jgi:hypothetical protein
MLQSGSAPHIPAAGDAAPEQRHLQQMPLAGSQVSPSGLNTVQAWGAGEGGACSASSARHGTPLAAAACMVKVEAVLKCWCGVAPPKLGTGAGAGVGAATAHAPVHALQPIDVRC